MHAREPQRVLQVFDAMDRGGAETLIMNVYRTIDPSEIQFDFLVHVSDERDYDSEIITRGGKIFHTFRFYGADYLPYRRSIRRFFKEHHDYAAVHIHLGSSAAIIIREAHRWNLFTIAHSHNTNPPISVPELGFRFFSHATRKLADAFLACSEQAGIDRFGAAVVNSDRFSVLPNGIDVEAYRFDADTRHQIRYDLGLDDNAPVFGHVGRFAPEKNHSFLIEVFSQIVCKQPTAVLLLVGRGPLEDEIRHDVERRGLSRNVRFLGVRNDVSRLLMAMDVFLFPSRWEGLGISAIEAQASGLPCLLSDSLPKAAIISPATAMLSIRNDASDWARLAIDDIENSCLDRREDGVQLARDAGYDIAQVAKGLTGLYLTNSIAMLNCYNG